MRLVTFLLAALLSGCYAYQVQPVSEAGDFVTYKAGIYTDLGAGHAQRYCARRGKRSYLTSRHGDIVRYECVPEETVMR